MRIVAGSWRGRQLRAAPGDTTRPTADRVRQAIFDMLWHAPWGGRDVIEGARVLDAFAGTGALGLEAVSRGAAHASFIERARPALAALRANISALNAADHCAVLAADVLAAPAAMSRGGGACTLIFLDPPYGQGLAPRALQHLSARGWIAPGALLIIETAADEALSFPGLAASHLAERSHGAARVSFWRVEAIS